MSVALQIARRDFGGKAVTKLAFRGITFIGVRALPDMTSDMPMANANRGYVVTNGNGNSRVLSYADVRKLIG